MSRVKLRNTHPRVRFGLEGVWLQGLRHPDSSEAWFDSSVMDLPIVQESLKRGTLLLVDSEVPEVVSPVVSNIVEAVVETIVEEAPQPAVVENGAPEEPALDLSTLTRSKVRGMRKSDLQTVAGSLGLPTTGKRPDLIEAILALLE